MGNVIPMHDPHQQAIDLLPWYANGTLDKDEAEAVEAHLAECAECRRELDSERAAARMVADLQIDVERGWTGMRRKVESAAPPPARRDRGSWPKPHAGRRFAIPWAVAAPAAAASLLVAMVVGLPTATESEEGSYRTLGSTAHSPAGNVVILFDPEATERDIRSALEQSSARMVDGPTASGAYVVRVPGETRATALERLRRLEQVVLAEPIALDEAREPS